ncbi:hypothetical protein AAMO2058_001305000 [Amorphochlora amoebiformis]
MPPRQVPCFYCMEKFHLLLQSTFMYRDHQFCSEKCRSAQIKMDMKVEKLQENLERTTNVVKRQSPQSRKFCEVFITSHEGTEFMQSMGLRSVLAKLEKGQRDDLAGNVVAGYIRWEPDSFKAPSDSPNGLAEKITNNPKSESHPCLMCFKTNSAMEIMLCDDRIDIPQKSQRVEVAPVLELRRQSHFVKKESLKVQIGYDRDAATRYLDSSSNNLRTSTCSRQIQTCQICTIV